MVQLLSLAGTSPVVILCLTVSTFVALVLGVFGREWRKTRFPVLGTEADADFREALEQGQRLVG